MGLFDFNKKKLILLVILLILLYFTSKTENDKDMFNNDVIELSDENIDENINKYEFLFVIFYSPWCAYCKSFGPIFSQAATELKVKNVYFGKLDGPANGISSTKYNVDAFPTVYFFTNGQVISYGGERNKGAIIDWINEKINKTFGKLSSLEELEKVKKENEVIIVYFGDSEEEIKMLKKIMYNYDFKFFMINSKVIIEKQKVKTGTIILFKHYDELKDEFSPDKITEENTKEFISKNLLPLIIPLSSKNEDLLFSKVSLVIFIDKELSLEKTALLKKISKKYRDEMIFGSVLSKNGEKFVEKLKKKFAVENYPAIRIYDNDKEKLYKYRGEIKENSIIDFIENFKAGKLKRHYFSEPIPKQQTNNIYYIVGYSFKKQVIESKKDVLVYFSKYNNRIFYVIYNELSKKLRNNKDLLISAFNLNKNECEEVEKLNIKDECIYLYPGNNKENPIKYKGKDTLEEIEKFIKKNVFNKIINKKEDL